MTDKNTTYTYQGDGLGIPGLPHRTTKEEARLLGMLETLEAAIARGDYKPETAGKRPAESEE